MVKKGFDLFTTTGQIAEDYTKYARYYTCSLCTAPYFCLCMAVCKYRSATFGEYIEHVLGVREEDMF